MKFKNNSITFIFPLFSELESCINLLPYIKGFSFYAQASQL